jgi:Ca2+-binding RTX toxin-like protein
MARLTTYSGSVLMENSYSLPLDYAFQKASVTYWDRYTLEGYLNGEYFEIGGDFKIKKGVLKSGVITSIYSTSGATYELDGLQLSIKQLRKLFKNSRKRPDALFDYARSQFNGDDIITGGSLADELRGWAGNDYLKDASLTDGERDIIYGGEGDDTIEFTGGFDHLYGESGRNVFRVGGYFYTRSSGWATIHDYKQGIDRFELASSLQESGAVLSTRQIGSDLQVYLSPFSGSSSSTLVAWIENASSL